MPTFKDHFSGHAAGYAASRPGYPDALFEFLAGQCDRRERAWDCATGNGQAARSLTNYFDTVIATDASAEQIAAADTDLIDFRVATAEDSKLESNSIDLLTVAQALHWFDIDGFFSEAWRVCRPGGILAVWCYGTCSIAGDSNRIVQDYYAELDPWWPPERDIVESGYRDITLPGEPVECPALSMAVEWTAQQMLDYLGSWSATARRRAATGQDPLAEVAPLLQKAWGGHRLEVQWPLHLMASRLQPVLPSEGCI